MAKEYRDKPSKRHDLQDLPPAVRQTIYSYLTCSVSDGSQLAGGSSILLTCRSIYEEAAPVLYRSLSYLPCCWPSFLLEDGSCPVHEPDPFVLEGLFRHVQTFRQAEVLFDTILYDDCYTDASMSFGTLRFLLSFMPHLQHLTLGIKVFARVWEDKEKLKRGAIAGLHKIQEISSLRNIKFSWALEEQSAYVFHPEDTREKHPGNVRYPENARDILLADVWELVRVIERHETAPNSRDYLEMDLQRK